MAQSWLGVRHHFTHKLNVLESVDYDYVGCYRDDEDDRVFGNKIYESTDINPNFFYECLAAVKGLGLNIFGVQDRKFCWTSSQANKTEYDKHGVAENCKYGMGGTLANSVYEIKPSKFPNMYNYKIQPVDQKQCVNLPNVLNQILYKFRNLTEGNMVFPSPLAIHKVYF